MGHDHTFSLWMPSCRAMGYKSKGNGKSWGDGACRRGYGRPERERPYMTTPFPFGFLLAMLWDIKPRGNGKPWAMEPAVEDTDGRSVSDRTRPHFFFFGLCSTRSPYRGTGFRYRIRLLPCLACGMLPDGTIPWR